MRRPIKIALYPSQIKDTEQKTDKIKRKEESRFARFLRIPLHIKIWTQSIPFFKYDIFKMTQMLPSNIVIDNLSHTSKAVYES